MYKFIDSLLNSEGQPIVGASVSVFAAGTSTLAQLYEDDQTTLKTNPLTSDSTGLVQCKAANGKYDVQYATLTGVIRRINGVIFDDPAEAGAASIALAMPGEFTVSGSPGNSLTVTKKNQTANTMYAGPAAGVAAAPTFRGIVSEDLPAATTSARGAVQLATATVASTGTSTTDPITPATFNNNKGANKASGRFDGTTATPTIVNSLGVISITKSAAGRYIGTLSFEMPNAQYNVHVSGSFTDAPRPCSGKALTKTTFQIYTLNTGFQYADIDNITFQVFE